MRDVPILNAASGVNTLAKDGALGTGEVRTAENVVLRKDGGFARRAGYQARKALANARDLWMSSNGTLLGVADGSLLRVDPDTLDTTEIATGLWDFRVRYCEHAGEIIVSCGRIIRVKADGTATTAGVQSLAGFTPRLTAGAGDLTPGKYAVAIAAVNAIGEEGGLCELAQIELTSDGSISFDFPPKGPETDHWAVYRTRPNGTEFFLVDETPPSAAGMTMLDSPLGRRADNWMKDFLPEGTEICSYQGRLYSASGKFVFYTDALSFLCDRRFGFIAHEGDVTLLVPVDDGLFLGTEKNVQFLKGNGPDDFQLVPAAANGAIKYSGCQAPADMFNQRAIQQTSPVAVWLSPRGFQIGINGGSVLSPQADRIAVSGPTEAVTTPMQIDGVKQLVATAENLSLG